MPVSTKTPSSSKSKSKPTAKAPSKAQAKATAAKAKTAVKASVKSVAPQEVVEVKAASKKATAAATATATKAASKAKTKVSEPAKVESKPADKTKAKAKPSKSAVKSVEPQEVVEVKAKSKKAPAKATASKATKADSKAKASEPAKVESKPTDKVKAKAKSAAKAYVKSAEPQEVVEVKSASKKAPAKVATATKAAAKKAATKVVAKAKAESKPTANAKGAAKVSVKSVEPQEVVEVKAKSKKAPAKATATKLVSKAQSSEPAKAAKAGAKTKAKVVAKGYEVYAEPSEGVEAEFKDITLLNKEERYELMRLLQEQNPNPKSELEFKNTFELLCAVVLSAQATDASVNKATPALFKAAPDPKSMAKLGAEGIAPYIQSIGLWKNKAKFLAQLSQALLDKYDGKVPGSFDELVALPGVGSKTAKVVLNVAFGQPFIAVDTHVYRVATRTGLCLGKCPGQVEDRISPLVAEPFLKEAHHYLLLHGRYNCTAQRFEGHCDKCVVAKYCKHNYERKEK